MKSQKQPVEILQEIFYNQEKTLYQFFEEFKHIDKNGKAVLTPGKFEELAKKYSKLTVSEISGIFSMIKKENSFQITFQEFDRFFKLDVPADKVRFSIFPDAAHFEQESAILTKVLEWMMSRSYTSEEAFERLLSSVSRKQQKNMKIYDFQKAIMQEIGLKTPEIDFLFEILTKGAKEVDSSHWQAVIRTQVPNPLEHMRKVIKAKGLTPDALMSQLGLKPLDLPLDKK